MSQNTLKTIRESPVKQDWTCQKSQHIPHYHCTDWKWHALQDGNKTKDYFGIGI